MEMILKLNKSQLIHVDCLDVINKFPDNSIDVCLTDPPYGIEYQSARRTDKDKWKPKIKNDDRPFTDWIKPLYSKLKDGGRLICFYRWDVQDDFLDEINDAGFIVKSQIIWGGNNFIEYLYSTNCWIFWYKRNPMKNYSDGEFAWTSFNTVSRCLPLDHYGSHTSDKLKIHPTQKPIALYDWLLKNYAKTGYKILDTHLGSGSSRISAKKTILIFGVVN